MQRAAVEHIDELIALWKEVFSDDDSFLIPFLEARRDSSDVYYTEKDGRIVSQIWYLAVKAIVNQQTVPMQLIVGVATDKAYRKQGLMTSLINETRMNYTCPLVLYPAVRGYYEKNGFFSSSRARMFTLSEKQLKMDDEHDAARLDDIYTEAIRAKGGLLRDSFAWHGILEDNLLISTKEAYALYSPEKKLITEAAAASKEGAMALIERLGGKVTAIPGSIMEQVLIDTGTPSEEVKLGMCSENLDIYIAEQY